ncbi:MAG TPA: glycosyl hydrolase family 28-related protein [Verrucomicrobiae bacterium]|nr:glycosyl hydrolase family 28-related protein [Verrucomicrobiae bacterium]
MKTFSAFPRWCLAAIILFVQPIAYAVDNGSSAAARPVVFNVKAFGATGNGQTLDTEAVDRTIAAAAAAGGGTVYFPAGAYACYTIDLKSNITLYLDSGATLLAADPPPEGEPGGYDAPEPNAFDKYQDFGHSHWRNSLIWGEGLQNISIIGPGLIFGRGLSRGVGRKDPLPGEPYRALPPSRTNAVTAATPFGYPSPLDALPAGVGNKAIALKNCRNVIFRDFTVFHGGHFAILATGVDNFTIDNLKIDTNRDGIDIDCCVNVRVSNCTVNSPTDDGICPKSSYALGHVRATENLTIVNCQVSGYAEGSLLDGTYKRTSRSRNGRTGRIKFGTEANGGFKNITIANCVFDYCRGIALEEVDGGPLEDVSISNITMRNIVNAPIFIRLGARLRGPGKPPVGMVRRINISNVVAYNVSANHGILITGLPDHPIEDVSLSHIRIVYQGGGTKEQAFREVPEYETDYPEPSRFGTIPSWGMFLRHVKGFRATDIELSLMKDDFRPAFLLTDVKDAVFRFLGVPRVAKVPTFVLRDVEDFSVRESRPVPNTNLQKAEKRSL